MLVGRRRFGPKFRRRFASDTAHRRRSSATKRPLCISADWQLKTMNRFRWSSRDRLALRSRRTGSRAERWPIPWPPTVEFQVIPVE